MPINKSPATPERHRVNLLPVALVLAAALLSSCSGKKPESLGLAESRLRACPESPNCVSIAATDEEHSIEAFSLIGDAEEAWQAARRILAESPRTRIVTEGGNYLHAECTSRIFRFVDDLELQLRPDDGVIAVRSASRIGHSDLGVNRDRVESLRASLAEAGLVRPAAAAAD